MMITTTATIGSAGGSAARRWPQVKPPTGGPNPLMTSARPTISTA
jgi:hypothetical protein